MNNIKDLNSFDKNLFDKLKEVGYQSVGLRDFEDNIIITYNTPKQKVEQKLNEIKKRFTVLSPGIYKLMAMQKHGSRGKADTFLIKHGNFDADNFIQTAKPAKTLEEQPHVLSYAEALKNIQLIAQLTAERDALKKENEQLRVELAEAEAELNTLEENPEKETDVNTWTKTLSELSTAALPIMDKYFETKNRALQLEENKLYIQNKNLFQPQPQRPARQQQGNQYPDLNNEKDVNLFLDELDKLNDDQLHSALAIIQMENPPLFDICIDVFFNTDANEQQEVKEGE